MHVFVSGVHSDPDPSPGLGLARSIKQAFPETTLTGIDYSVRSTGLHSQLFDHVVVQPVWNELNLDAYAAHVASTVNDLNSCWISGLDVELDWLANAIGTHARLLAPSSEAQRVVRKPKILVAGEMGMRVPPWLPAVSPPSALHRLGRHSGWHLWLKGVYHEAYPAFGFEEVTKQIERLEQHWSLNDIFVQAHVPGLERAYTFAAYQGRLLGAVEVEKRSLTAQGKTWAARVDVLPPSAQVALQELVGRLSWTGGGEIEFVRSADGQNWLIDFNPRFPAYIHGVSLCGPNLPALLVGAALGRSATAPKRVSRQFVRVIEEIPCRDDLLLPELVMTQGGMRQAGKHPSNQPQLAKRMRLGQKPRFTEADDEGGRSETHLAAKEAEETPARLRDDASFRRVLTDVSGALSRSESVPAMTPALSIKTDPQLSVGALARDAGWWAEAISSNEMHWALRAGFSPSQIVCNGPATATYLKEAGPRVGVAFADSVEALELLIGLDAAETVGLRLRMPSIRSRFGVDLSDYSLFRKATRCLAGKPVNGRYGLHFHVASDVCGPSRWFELFDEVLDWASAVSCAVGAGPIVLDIGGGWQHEDFRELFLPAISGLQAKVHGYLPSVSRVLFEPGKGVLSETATLMCRVLEVRRQNRDKLEVVVDASIADLPMALLYAHPILMMSEDGFRGWLGGGASKILGSICMETDVLAQGVSFPRVPTVGDRVVFMSAGGYNASMAWDFARGTSRDVRS